jgi:hypothetical protein
VEQVHQSHLAFFWNEGLKWGCSGDAKGDNNSGSTFTFVPSREGQNTGPNMHRPHGAQTKQRTNHQWLVQGGGRGILADIFDGAHRLKHWSLLIGADRRCVPRTKVKIYVSTYGSEKLNTAN